VLNGGNKGRGINIWGEGVGGGEEGRIFLADFRFGGRSEGRRVKGKKTLITKRGTSLISHLLL